MRTAIILYAVTILAGAAAIGRDSSTYVAAGIGGFYSGVSHFDELSDSRIALSYGGSCGFPISEGVSFYLKVTYFSKSGIRVTSLIHHDEMGRPLATPVSMVGNERMSQLTVNVGVSHSVSLAAGSTLEPNMGITHVQFRSSPDVLLGPLSTPPVKTHDALGGFAGVSFVQRLGTGPLAIFVEGQYNHLWPIGNSQIPAYGALNICGGMRLCLGCPD
jgi:hypothetical protein